MNGHRGFGTIGVLIGILLAGLIGVLGWVYIQQSATLEENTDITPISSATPEPTLTPATIPTASPSSMEKEEIEDQIQLAAGVEISKFIHSPSGAYVLYSVWKIEATAIGGAKIADVYDWYIYTVATGEITEVTAKSASSDESVASEIFEAFGWHNDTTIVVRDGGILDVSSYYLYDISTDSFTPIPVDESYRDYLLNRY